MGLKVIFSKQLPNMPKEYICRCADMVPATLQAVCMGRQLLLLHAHYSILYKHILQWQV
jgi:hypothetical protein